MDVEQHERRRERQVARHVEKRLLVNRSGLVKYVADGTDIGHVGGLEHLKTWLLERRKLFAMRDSLNADIVPKGVLIMGISGCCKSLSIKAIASYFGLPLYRVNMTDIFSGLHGPAEAAFAQACRILEEIAPAVVWFDEIEMGITSQENTGEQGRIFAFFLTWMQEKARGVFVAATANRIDLLPAEMIRKGRFDEVFFVDLPGDEERVEILNIHLQRRGVPRRQRPVGHELGASRGHHEVAVAVPPRSGGAGTGSESLPEPAALRRAPERRIGGEHGSLVANYGAC